MLNSIGFQLVTKKDIDEWNSQVAAFSQACQAIYQIPKFKGRVTVAKIDQTNESLSFCDIRPILLCESVTFEEIALYSQSIPTEIFLAMMKKYKKLKLGDCTVGKEGDEIEIPTSQTLYDIDINRCVFNFKVVGAERLRLTTLRMNN